MRVSSFTPSASSRLRICLLIADCDVFNSVAARLTLAFRATASKASKVLVSGIGKCWFFKAGSRLLIAATYRNLQSTTHAGRIL